MDMVYISAPGREGQSVYQWKTFWLENFKFQTSERSENFSHYLREKDSFL